MLSMLERVLQHNELVATFALVGIVMGLSVRVPKKLVFRRVYDSAITIMIGLVLAYWGGMQTSGRRGLADLRLFGGIGLMGGAMLHDFAIVTMALGVQVAEVRKTGMIGVISPLLETVLPFIVDACVAYAFDYTDPMSVTTIDADAVMYIVGPVAGAALGATPSVMALSIATDLVKVILVMVGTPFTAKMLGSNNPRAAMVFGGLASTVSGVSAGLAVTDRRPVPYSSLVTVFHVGFGCLPRPSTLFLAT